MSQRTLGKSGEKILKDAIKQFRAIITQINEGAKKVRAKLSINDKKVAKIQDENTRLELVMSEALIAADNLEAILSKKVLTEPIVDETDETEEATTEK